MEKRDLLIKRVLGKITPGKVDRVKVESISKDLVSKVSFACKLEGIDAVVRVEGSVAKDTWLRENPDIDVFVRLPTSIPRANLGEVGLKVARKAAEGLLQVERFAEHPYLEVLVDGYWADIVPCYDAAPGEWRSATDRTPYHTDYVIRHLKADLRGQVRLLKKFMQAIGVYGAEIKVGGFSGYLCELLIMRYGSFVETLEAFASYDRGLVVDIEGFYAQRQRELSLLFGEALVVVDPVDRGRNVASAVKPEKLYLFVGAARAFLKKSGWEFFDPPEMRVLSVEDLKRQLSARGSSMVFVVVDQVGAVPDVIWGQLYRTVRSLRKVLQLSDFKVLRSSVWSDENAVSVFVFELEQRTLSRVRRHVGPPLERKSESEHFLDKYAGNKAAFSGPYVEDGRWVVEIPRKTTDAVALLVEKLADGGKGVGVASLIAGSIRAGFEVLVDDEIAKRYGASVDFARFLTDFLAGRPFWLVL